MAWLISKALMNSLYLPEQVAGFLEGNSLDGTLSAPLNGSNIPQAYCAPDKMTGFSRLSQFGMMYKRLTESRGEALLTLYREGFHAKTLAQQEKEQELTGNEAECGEKWLASFTKYDPNLCLWKTHQCSLLGDLDEFLETWPQWGLMRSGECWEQRTLEQTIKGTGFGLSPNGLDSFHTPNTTGLDGGSNSRKALRKKMEKLPTPQATDYRSKPTSASWKAKGGVNFSLSNPDIQAKWPTPTSHNSKETNAPSEYMRDTPSLTATIMMRKWGTPKAQDSRYALSDRGKGNLGEQVSGLHGGGKLNPMWVEWLMGWPLGWTDLKPLEMDKFPSVPLLHGES
jgi:DNA (cytosine-5)-methyltransferase 1